MLKKSDFTRNCTVSQFHSQKKERLCAPDREFAGTREGWIVGEIEIIPVRFIVFCS